MQFTTLSSVNRATTHPPGASAKTHPHGGEAAPHPGRGWGVHKRGSSHSQLIFGGQEGCQQQLLGPSTLRDEPGSGGAGPREGGPEASVTGTIRAPCCTASRRGAIARVTSRPWRAASGNPGKAPRC